MQRAGDDLLINVQLIDPATDNHLWAESYKRRFEKIFDVEAEVARSVADALKVNVPLRNSAGSMRCPRPIRARTIYSCAPMPWGRTPTSRALERKIALLQEAVAEDPHYAVAWGDLAGAYLTIADAYRAPLEVLEPMRRAALTAVQSDDKAAVGHIWRAGGRHALRPRFPAREERVERAVALDPEFVRCAPLVPLGTSRAWNESLTPHAPNLGGPVHWIRSTPGRCGSNRPSTSPQGDYGAAMQLAEHVMEIDPALFSTTWTQLRMFMPQWVAGKMP